MGEGLLDPMAQDEEVGQEMLVVEEEQFFHPQMDPEPEMGTAAAGAAVHDAFPPLSTKTLPRSLPKLLTQAHPTWPKYAPCWRE